MLLSPFVVTGNERMEEMMLEMMEKMFSLPLLPFIFLNVIVCISLEPNGCF